MPTQFVHIRRFPVTLPSGRVVWYFPFNDDNDQICWRSPYIVQDGDGDGNGNGEFDVEEAPQDGKPYVRQNGQWVEQQTSLSHVDEYNFYGTLTEPPAAGQLRMDSEDQTQATKIWISDMTAPGIDIGAIVRLAEPGWIVSIQDKDQASKAQSYHVSAVTPSSGYTALTVTHRSGNEPLVVQRVMVMLAGTKILA